MKNFRELPLLIKAIVIGLIVAPFGNFAATFSALGLRDWYSPLQFVKYAAQVSAMDWVWNLLLLVSGCLLLLRRKLAWALAVSAIFLALAANFINWYYGRIAELDGGFFAITSLGSVAMLGILFYFRYPHLDRRDRWLTSNQRQPSSIKVIIARPVKVEAMLINISNTGALLEIPHESIGSFPQHTHITFALPTGKHVNGQVVRLSPNSVGISFDATLTKEDLKF